MEMERQTTGTGILISLTTSRGTSFVSGCQVEACGRTRGAPCKAPSSAMMGMTWSDAQRYCRKHYTDLASVRNQRENEEMQRFTKIRSVWIGLYRTREFSDQSDVTFRYWKSGQPDNFGGKQNCIASDLGNVGRWTDETCSRTLAFICYGEEKETPDNKPLLSTTVTPNEITTTEVDLTTGRPSAEITSSDQPATPEVDQTSPVPTEHVFRLEVLITSEKQLTEDDIINLVSVQFRNQLIEMGLPKSIKVGLRK